ncbi:leucine-rich repeat-containing protein 56 [Melanotaenia boesemani]|uniref:leucine-rich repeat-containing protein 56 n=1 Tax=Melanotaenia boesemani TaxID=1250792 RepID=UPI001C04AC12|nr:leucine-rich repeat-containing protein 56 [Melanotaenia boesemani]XP_041853088.1 leucine-rich repeat-containing protein 56 [Melanotaenia boesemani]
MNDCHGPVAQEVRPGTARVLVTELSGSGYINPTPVTKPCEDFDTEVELYLSPERLELLCGTQDLSHVTSLEVCVDTQENTLGNFGAYLPRLEQLRMNNSLIMSVRDLGTTLSNLQVLSMFRCCLRDLDGISSFTSLKELYVAYNNVSDLSQVGMLENLQLLDLEGNEVDDLVQVQYLGLCLKLQTLTLQGNPVCLHPNPSSSQVADYSYRAAVRELIPQLHYLDDAKVEEDRLTCCSTMEEDMDILRSAIKECNSMRAASRDEETADSGCPYSISGMHPSSSPAYIRPWSSAGFRPNTGSRPISATRSGILSPPGSRPGSSDSDLAAVEAETSLLTHGAGKILFCGNPVQAIRARREKLKTAPTRSTQFSRDLPIHIPEHTYDLETPDRGERVNVFAELRAWREEHSRHLQAIEKERTPQILAIHHGGEEETYDGAEDGFDCMRSNSSDEEWGEEKHCDSLDTGSLDSSILSLSPELHPQESLSTDVSRLSLSPDNTFSPSPPPVCTTAAPADRKLPKIRARRLRLTQANLEHSLDFGIKGCTPGTGANAAETDLIFQRVQQKTRSKVPLLPRPVHLPHPPPTYDPQEGLMDSGVDMDLSKVHSGVKKKMSKILDRPAISRPHTARAVLQKHHQHPLLQPCRGSSHPD